MFFELTRADETPVLVNIEQIIYIRPVGDGAEVVFARRTDYDGSVLTEHSIIVNESFDQIYPEIMKRAKR